MRCVCVCNRETETHTERVHVRVSVSQIFLAAASMWSERTTYRNQFSTPPTGPRDQRQFSRLHQGALYRLCHKDPWKINKKT